MGDYDPRTATGIPTEPVGSMPRPSKLQEAYAQYDSGDISKDDLDICSLDGRGIEPTGSVGIPVAVRGS